MAIKEVPIYDLYLYEELNDNFTKNTDHAVVLDTVCISHLKIKQAHFMHNQLQTAQQHNCHQYSNCFLICFLCHPCGMMGKSYSSEKQLSQWRKKDMDRWDSNPKHLTNSLSTLPIKYRAT